MYFNKEKNIKKREIEKIEKEAGKKVKFEKNKVVKIGREKVILVFFLIVVFSCIYFLFSKKIYGVEFFKTLNEEEVNRNENIDVKTKGNVFKAQDENVFYEGNIMYKIPSKNIGEEKYSDVFVPVIFSKLDKGLSFSFQENLKSPNENERYVKENTNDPLDALDYDASGELRFVKSIFSKDNSNLNNISREMKNMLNYGFSKMYLTETDENIRREKKTNFFKEIFGEASDAENKLEDTDVYIASQLYVWDIINKRERNFSKIKREVLNQEGEPKTEDISSEKAKAIKKIYEFLMENSNSNKEFNNQYKRPDLAYGGLKNIDEKGLILKDVKLNIPESMTRSLKDFKVLIYSKTKQEYILLPAANIKLIYNGNIKEMNLNELSNFSKENDFKTFNIDLLIDRKYLEENFGSNEKLENLDFSRIKLKLEYKYLENIPVVYRPEKEEYKSALNILKNNDEYTKTVDLIYKQNDLRLDLGLLKINNIPVTGRDLNAKNIDVSNLLNLVNPEGKATNFTSNLAKERLEVLPKDKLEFNIKVINEGDNPAYAGDILCYIPKGMDVDLNEEINQKYGWSKISDNIYVSSYLKNKKIEESKKIKKNEETNIMKLDDENIKIKTSINSDNDNLKTLDVFAKLANSYFIKNSDENLENGEENFGSQLDDILEGGEKSNLKNNSKDNSNILDDIVEDFKPEENKENAKRNSKESGKSETQNSNKDKNKKEKRKDQKQVENQNKKSEGTTNLDFYLNEDRDSTYLKEDRYIKYFNEKEFLKDLEKRSDDLSKEELIINEKSDLSLKIIPFEKNGEKILDFDSTKNVDTKNLKNIENKDNKEAVDLDAKYNISKNVLGLKEGDVLKFKICIFNEGNVDEVAEKVSVFLPSNLELIENDNANLKEGWYKDSGCISTEKIKENLIKKPFKTDKALNLAKYEIELLVEVKDVKKGKNVNDQNEVFGMLAEIKKQQRIDRDSFANNIDFEKLNEKELNKEIKKHLSKDSNKDASQDEKTEESKGNINKDTLEYKMLEDDTDYFAFKLLEEKRDLALRIKALKIGESKAPNRNENVLENIDVSQIYDENQNKLKDKEEFEKGNIIYNSPKNPINVNQNERMTFEISMFNEAKEDTKGQKIRVFVPEYLDFLDEEKSAVNKKYGWKRLSTNPKIIETEYLEDKDIKGLREKTKENKGSKESIISREIVELELISKQMVEDENQVIIAEIAKGKNGDKDSVSGNLNFEYMTQNPKAFLDEYMMNLQNLDLSENKYFRCLEDDDDFEMVVYKNKALDLSLKMFTTGINNTKIEEEPLVNVSEVLKNKQSAYKNIKNPKVINKGDLIRNKIRIYNEGEKAGLATGIKIYIPEGMGYVMENKTNIKNLWKIEKANQPEYLSKYTNEKLEDNKKQIFEVDMDDPLIIKGPAVLKRNEIKAVGEKPYDLIPPLSNMKDIYYLDYEFCTVVLEENKDRSNNIEGTNTNEIKAENINFRAEYISEHQSTENAQSADAQINTNSNINQNEANKEEKREKNKAENKKEEELLAFAEITETFSEDGSLDKDSVADNFSKDTFSFTDKEDDTDFLVFTLKNTKVDLFLKMGVSKIWEEGTKRSLGYSRIDIKEDINLNEKIENNDVDKKPLDISEKDNIELKIRVYNRGNISAFAKQISIYIPEELEYDTESEINKNTKYRTYTKDGKATREKEEIKMLKTNILSYEELLALGKNNPILSRDRNGNLNYHEITLVLKVKENNIKTNEKEEVNEKENKNSKEKKKIKDKNKDKNKNNNKDEKDLNKIGSFRVYSEIDEVTDIYGNYLKDEKSNYGSFKNTNLDGLQVIEDDTDYEVFKKIDFIIRPEINLKGVGLTKRNKKGILEYIKTDVEENKKSINLNLSDIKKAQTMELIYKIDIENIGEIEGNVTELEVDIPENFGLSVKNRAFWSMKSKNKISTTDISKFVLNPGDKKSLNLILDADVNLVDTSSLLASVNIAKTYNEYDIENLNLNSNLNTSKTNIKILDIKNKIYYPLVTVLSLILASLIANNIYIFVKNKKMKNMNKMKNNINII